jgi:hypothetical protein
MNPHHLQNHFLTKFHSGVCLSFCCGLRIEWCSIDGSLELKLLLDLYRLRFGFLRTSVTGDSGVYQAGIFLNAPTSHLSSGA